MRDRETSAEEPQPGTGVRHLSTILDCVAEGVITVGPERRIRFFNRAAEQITGYSKEEALGRPCRDVFRTEVCDASCILEAVETSGRSVINRPVRILDRDGRPVLVSVNAAALYGPDGQVIGGVETFRDLSTEDELRRQIDKSYTFHDIVSRHPEMHRMFAILPDVAESDFPVLIEGESGTGKELFARALHNLSHRQDGPFVAVNCAALPDALLESELFGYRKGAFTDAKADKRGRFDLAQGGTLFLDEIGDVSPALQVKLLRVLQEKTYEPLGANEPVSANVRILAATHRKLAEEVRVGRFREDFYYRLNVLRLELPPLRDRRCDIPPLIEHIRCRLNAETGKHIEGVDDAVIRLLMGHPFPGNIREVENIMQHAFVMCKGSVIQTSHLPLGLGAMGSVADEPCTLAEMEERAIREALLSHDGNRTAAARQLAIDPSTLYRKMKRLGLR